MKRVKLVKIQELEKAKHPNNIPINYEKDGFLIEEPIINQCFWLYTDKWSREGFRTSVVQKIIDKDTFETYNSIYKIIREDINE